MIAKKKLASLVQIKKKSQKIKNFIKKCNYKTYVSFTSNFFVILFLILTYHFFNFLVTTFISINNMDYQIVDKKIDYLIKIIKSLAFLV